MEANVIRYYNYGDPIDVLKMEEKNIIVPGPEEILVRMIARTINPSDIIPVRGAYPHRTILPAIPGYEGVGVVEHTGKRVSPIMMNKRVLPLMGEGTWQEIVRMPAERAIMVPDYLDNDTASQLYINPVTAWLICVNVLNLKPGDTLVVNACGSSIGRIFTQLSTIFGFQLIAVTRNDNHTKDLLRIGAAHVINTSYISVREAVLQLTEGRGATAAIDCIGGWDGIQLVGGVKSGGTVLCIGLLSGISVNWAEVTRNTGVNVRLFWLRQWVHNSSPQTWHEVFGNIIKLVKDGKLELMKVGARFDLSNFKYAIQAVESGIHGKVLLTS
ncbi:MAG TPA: zinc-dependent alcohol dehydrogenase family protein [Paenibacillus sp.]